MQVRQAHLIDMPFICVLILPEHIYKVIAKCIDILLLNINN